MYGFNSSFRNPKRWWQILHLLLMKYYEALQRLKNGDLLRNDLQMKLSTHHVTKKVTAGSYTIMLMHDSAENTRHAEK